MSASVSLKGKWDRLCFELLWHAIKFALVGKLKEKSSTVRNIAEGAFYYFFKAFQLSTVIMRISIHIMTHCCTAHLQHPAIPRMGKLQ